MIRTLFVSSATSYLIIEYLINLQNRLEFQMRVNDVIDDIHSVIEFVKRNTVFLQALIN